MAHLRGGFSKHLAPGYFRVMVQSYKQRPLEGDKLVNIKSSSRAYEEDFQVAGFGTLQYKPEGAAVAMQDMLEGNSKRYRWSTYALGSRITRELQSDNLYGSFVKKISTLMGRSARNNKEIVMHSVLNNAFSTSYTGWESGVALCSTSHTLLRAGTTVANKPATDVDFGLIPLQAALEHFHNLTDDSGFPTVHIPRLVVHSIGDYWMVNQVLKTPQLPGGNLNDVNQVSREGLTAHLSHYLTDTDAWFVLADQHDMNYFQREPLSFGAWDDDPSGDAMFRAWQRHGSGFSDWRGVYGSQGA